MSDLGDRPHALYRFRDAAGQLLYIGITVDIAGRFPRHAAEKPWWRDVTRIDVEALPGRAEALEAERAAIQAERPVHNVRHNGDRPATASMPPRPPVEAFVGSYFLAPDPRGWQGQILSRVRGDTFLVETFSWMTGEPWTRHLVELAEMGNWIFFVGAEWMVDYYKQVAKAKWEHERIERAKVAAPSPEPHPDDDPEVEGDPAIEYDPEDGWYEP